MTKYGRPSLRRTSVEDAGDMRMVHHGQCLAFRFEPRDHLLGIHTELDDL